MGSSRRGKGRRHHGGGGHGGGQRAAGRHAGGTPAGADALLAAGEGSWLHELAEFAADPERWATLDEDTLLLLVYQQCLFFAHTRDAGAASALAGLYPHVVARVALRERLALLDRLTEALEDGNTPVLALLPFLQHEPEPAAVALAAAAFATLVPLEDDDAMSGPRAVLRLAELAEDEGTRAGLLAGLLTLGDRRVLPLLREGWTALEPAARVRLAALRPASPLAFEAVVEFWLGALATPDADDATRAACAGALAAVATGAVPARVFDVRRRFPLRGPDDREEIEILRENAIAVYARQLEPHLRALAPGVLPPAALPALLSAWGLPAA